MIARSLASALLLFVLLAARGKAQETPPLEPHSRVRTTIAGVKREFTLLELRPDTIRLLDPATNYRELRLAVSEIDSLHVSISNLSPSRRAARGAVRGILVMGSIGMILGFIEGDDDTREFWSMTGPEKGLLYGTLLGVIGGGVGAIHGALTADRGWKRVLPP
jgi:hypothetical protein